MSSSSSSSSTSPSPTPFDLTFAVAAFAIVADLAIAHSLVFANAHGAFRGVLALGLGLRCVLRTVHGSEFNMIPSQEGR
jgi:hypothetical protein